MRIIISIILTALLSFIAGIYFPWWSIAVVAFLVALLIPQTIMRSFLSGFFAIFILWSVLALWIDYENSSILSQKVAALFSLGYSFLIIIVTGLVGALVGGFAAMSGGALAAKRGNE